MKSVNDLFAMQNIMTHSILNKTEFIYNDIKFSREEWIEWCEEQEGVRFCQECGELITNGFLVDNGNTYCSIECVKNDDSITHTDIEEFNNAIKNNLDWDNDHFYYTEWCEEL
jgi:hypothetical protein